MPPRGERQAVRTPDERARLLPDGVDGRTVTLFLLGFSVWLSATTAARIQIEGLLFHPYLIALIALAFMTGLTALARFPRPMRNAMIAYVIVFAVATMPGGASLSEPAKGITLLLTVWILATSIRNETDFRAAVLGYTLSIAALSVTGLLDSAASVEGVDPIANATRTAWSLYSLPALLLAGAIVIDDSVPKRFRALMGGNVLVITLATFASANRSGWLGAIVAGALLASRGRRTRDTALICIVGAVAYVVLVGSGWTLAFEDRLNSTLEGNDSDSFRVELFEEALEIGRANPILGISPQRVDNELGRRVLAPGGKIDAHNIIGYLIAGGGVLLFGTFVWMCVALWRRPGDWWANGPPGPREKLARSVLRIVIVVLIARGIFSQDVITVPPFMIAIGLTVGWTMANFKNEGGELPRGRPSRGRKAQRRTVTPRLPDLFEQERQRRHAQLAGGSPITEA